MKRQPNPGSDEAIKRGCVCPVMDNANGKGRGDGLFYVSSDCPLHGQTPAPDVEPTKRKP